MIDQDELNQEGIDGGEIDPLPLQGLSTDQVDQLRGEIAAEVWAESQDGDTSPAPKQTDDSDDPWSSLHPKVKESIESMTTRIRAIDEIEARLKQAESRVGSIQNQIYLDRQAAANKPQPTEAEVLSATKNDEAWNEFKDEFPEIAAGVESRLSNQVPVDFDKRVDVAIAAREEPLRNEVLQAREEIARAKEELRLETRYPEYRDILSTPDYQSWIAGQPDNIKVLTGSSLAVDAIKVLDEFTRQSPNGQHKKTASEIHRERQERLKASQVVPGRQASPPKSTLSREEIWKQTAKEVWS